MSPNIIKPDINHSQALSELAQLCFTETFGHLYPATDLNDFLQTTYNPQTLWQEIQDDRNFWRIVLDQDMVAIAYLMTGSVSLPHQDADPLTQGEIKRIYVRQSHQGQGLGKQLMHIGLDHLQQTYGKAKQWIGVFNENHKAISLYNSYGFTKVGEYGFKVGQTLDHEFILNRQT